MLDVNMGCNAQGGQRTVTRAAFGNDLHPEWRKHGDAVALRPARPGQRGAGGRAAARHRRGRRGVNGFYCYPNSDYGTVLSLEFEQAGTAVENGVCSIYLSYDAPFTITGDIEIYICGDGLAGSYHDAASGGPGGDVEYAIIESPFEVEAVQYASIDAPVESPTRCGRTSVASPACSR